MTCTSLLFVLVVSLETYPSPSVSLRRSPTSLETLPTRCIQGLHLTRWQRYLFIVSRVTGSPTPIAVLDSGTTFILDPSADVVAFGEIVGGARSGNGLWQINVTGRYLFFASTSSIQRMSAGG
jgi:hypothetical protein